MVDLNLLLANNSRESWPGVFPATRPTRIWFFSLVVNKRLGLRQIAPLAEGP